MTRYGVLFREVNYDGVENVRLDASDAAKHNTFSLVAGASGTSYTVHAGAGDDTFDFGNSDVDTNMPNTNWTLLGETGSDVLRYFDEADTGSTDTYTIKGQAVTKTYGANAANVYFNSLSSLQLSANTGGTDIAVEELSQATTIFAGGGADDITIQDTYQAVGTGAYIALTLDAGTGLDTVRLTDIAHVQFEQSQDLANLVVGAGGLVKVKPSIGEMTMIDTQLFSGNGRVDLANGAMAIRDWPINDVGFIRSRLINGYDNGSWYTPGGPAIYSTTSDDGIGALGYGTAGAVGLTQIGGTSLNAQDLVIRKTIYGDANIDGKVDFDDLLSLAKAYGQTNQHWSNGDFDYNGSVDFNDLLSIAKNYGQPVAVLASPFSSTPIGSNATRRRSTIDL